MNANAFIAGYLAKDAAAQVASPLGYLRPTQVSGATTHGLAVGGLPTAPSINPNLNTLKTTVPNYEANRATGAAVKPPANTGTLVTGTKNEAGFGADSVNTQIDKNMADTTAKTTVSTAAPTASAPASPTVTASKTGTPS